MSKKNYRRKETKKYSMRDFIRSQRKEFAPPAKILDDTSRREKEKLNKKKFRPHEMDEIDDNY